MDRPYPFGATVTLHVVPHALGRMLHRLEYRPDIHIVTMEEDGMGMAITLRSDSFPKDWEGANVRAVVEPGSLGVDHFVPVARRARRLKKAS